MKNIIILILSLFLACFMLNSLGVFKFASIIDDTYRESFAKNRILGVKKSDTFNIAIIGNEKDISTSDAIEGIKYAVEEINEQGGVLGKMLSIEFSDANNLTKHNMLLQEFANRKEIAVCVAPFNSDYIASMRCLSHYSALPLISPLTVFSSSLAFLEEENFISFFPYIEDWTNTISMDIKDLKYKNILVISPEENTYGYIFANHLERWSQNRYKFEDLYRINYQRPFNKNSFEQNFNKRLGSKVWDAMVFCGPLDDFIEFCTLLKELNIITTLYGTDDLDSESLLEKLDVLPKNLKLAYADYSTNKKKNYKVHLGFSTIYALKEVLEKEGEYNPEKLIKALYAYRDSEEYRSKNSVQIKIKEIKKLD